MSDDETEIEIDLPVEVRMLEHPLTEEEVPISTSITLVAIGPDDEIPEEVREWLRGRSEAHRAFRLGMTRYVTPEEIASTSMLGGVRQYVIGTIAKGMVEPLRVKIIEALDEALTDEVLLSGCIGCVGLPHRSDCPEHVVPD